jgi:hypothetical protein
MISCFGVYIFEVIMQSLSLRKKLLFSVVTSVLLLSIVEVGLWVYGFQYSQFPRKMKQEFADIFTKGKYSIKLDPHFERMWALKPN